MKLDHWIRVLNFLKGLKNSEILVIHIFQEKC